MSRMSVFVLLMTIIAIACGVTGLYLFLRDHGVETPPATVPAVISTPTAGPVTPTRPGGAVAPTQPGGAVAPTAGR